MHDLGRDIAKQPEHVGAVDQVATVVGVTIGDITLVLGHRQAEPGILAHTALATGTSLPAGAWASRCTR